MEWGELAIHLGLSRSMMDFVRTGKRQLSFKALRRLEQAEISAGITPPNTNRGSYLENPSTHQIRHTCLISTSIKNLTISDLEAAIEGMEKAAEGLRRVVKRLKSEG